MGAAGDHSESDSASNGFDTDSRIAALEIELRSVRELFLLEAQRTARLQHDLEGARIELMKGEERLNETIERFAAAEVERERLHGEEAEQLRAAADEARDETAQISKDLRAELVAQSRMVNSLRRSIEGLLRAQDRVQKRAAEAEATVLLQQSEIGRLGREFGRERVGSVDRADVLQGGLAPDQRNVECLHRELAELRAAKDSLEETLNGVLASRSWRLTRPVRWALRTLRRGRGLGR